MRRQTDWVRSIAAAVLAGSMLAATGGAASADAVNDRMLNGDWHAKVFPGGPYSWTGQVELWVERSGNVNLRAYAGCAASRGKAFHWHFSLANLSATPITLKYAPVFTDYSEPIAQTYAATIAPMTVIHHDEQSTLGCPGLRGGATVQRTMAVVVDDVRSARTGALLMPPGRIASYNAEQGGEHEQHLAIKRVEQRSYYDMPKYQYNDSHGNTYTETEHPGLPDDPGEPMKAGSAKDKF